MAHPLAGQTRTSHRKHYRTSVPCGSWSIPMVSSSSWTVHIRPEWERSNSMRSISSIHTKHTGDAVGINTQRQKRRSFCNQRHLAAELTTGADSNSRQKRHVRIPGYPRQQCGMEKHILPFEEGTCLNTTSVRQVNISSHGLNSSSSPRFLAQLDVLAPECQPAYSLSHSFV